LVSDAAWPPFPPSSATAGLLRRVLDDRSSAPPGQRHLAVDFGHVNDLVRSHVVVLGPVTLVVVLGGGVNIIAAAAGIMKYSI
jgi:hypothetical protein